MPSSPLGSTNGRTTSGVACHHRHLTANTIGRRRTFQAMTAIGQHTQSNDVGRGMPSSPLGSTNGRTTLGVACHHHLWAAHTVELRRAWHAIIAFGKHKRSNHVGCGMQTSRLGSTHGRTTSGVACQHCLLATYTVERRRAWHDITPLGSTHGQTMLGVA